MVKGDRVGRCMHHLLGQQPGLRLVDLLVLKVFDPNVPTHAAALRHAPLQGVGWMLSCIRSTIIPLTAGPKCGHNSVTLVCMSR